MTPASRVLFLVMSLFLDVGDHVSQRQQEVLVSLVKNGMRLPSPDRSEQNGKRRHWTVCPYRAAANATPAKRRFPSIVPTPRNRRTDRDRTRDNLKLVSKGGKPSTSSGSLLGRSLVQVVLAVLAVLAGCWLRGVGSSGSQGPSWQGSSKLRAIARVGMGALNTKNAAAGLSGYHRDDHGPDRHLLRRAYQVGCSRPRRRCKTMEVMFTGNKAVSVHHRSEIRTGFQNGTCPP
ncbi:hypothetical protein QBC45DRAFT_432547 [Copromyces sp. CBS 386.78]|nr:hypothetical protein QBC45DRAFT_432547 [Copromyces sp. CBS 386.78]